MVMLVSELRPNSCVVAEVRASPNHSERKNGMMPDMIVLHYTGTRDANAIRQLCNPASEVSAHYVVLQDGCILQLASGVAPCLACGCLVVGGGGRRQLPLDWDRCKSWARARVS